MEKTGVKVTRQRSTNDHVKPAITSSYLPEVELKELPSHNLSYPKDSVISYRPYTYGELLKLGQSKLSDESKIDAVLDGIKCSFDKEDLTYFDFLYIAILRRLSTFGSDKFSLKFLCRACGEEMSKVIALNGLEFEDLKVPALPVILKVNDNTELKFNPLTVGQYKELTKKELLDDPLSVLAMSATEDLADYEANKEIISNLSGALIEDLEKIDEELNFGIKNVEAKCSKCGVNNFVKPQGGKSMMLPFRESNESNESRIRYGVQSVSQS